jgi:osmotically-inducible protein OsmY
MALLFSVMTAACGRSDASVQSDLQQQLTTDPATAGAHLTVNVKEGTAILTGRTETMAQQQRAVDVARSVKGVKQVLNQMRVDDATLTEEVRKAIAADVSVNQIPLRIEVKDAEVSLYSDKTNSDERTRLKQLVGGVPGVAHVEDFMK